MTGKTRLSLVKSCLARLLWLEAAFMTQSLRAPTWPVGDTSGAPPPPPPGKQNTSYETGGRIHGVLLQAQEKQGDSSRPFKEQELKDTQRMAQDWESPAPRKERGHVRVWQSA